MMTENEFIDKWRDQSITLREWRESFRYDLWDNIDQMELDFDQVMEIEGHQSSLFNEAVNNFIGILKNQLDKIAIWERINRINEDLRVISKFINEDYSATTIKLISTIINIPAGFEDEVLIRYNKRKRFMGLDYRYDYLLNVPGKTFSSPSFIAQILLEYEIHLKSYKERLEVKPIITPYSKPFSKEGILQLSRYSKLQEIWKEKPVYSIEYVFNKCYNIGLWDENLNLLSKHNGLYGSKKSLLSNIYHALKGNSIPENFHYKLIGNILCDLFEISIEEGVNEPYKSFGTSNKRQVDSLKKALKNS